MAVRNNRERESRLLQTAAIGGTVAVLVLIFLMIRTLSFDVGQHQLRLEAIRTVSNLDAEITQVFLRGVTGAATTSNEDKQEASQRLADAVAALQQGPARLTGISPELDLALDTFLDTIIVKFQRGQEFDARNRKPVAQPDGSNGATTSPPSEQLSDFVNLPTGPQLAAVEQAYQAWYQGRIDSSNFYRTVLVGYTALLLLALAFLGSRLLQSYAALDKANAGLREANRTLESQVAQRTKDLTAALKNLKESQAQLIQSEKMASLGQMVAGVAHEINTPLGYARCNAEIVRNSLAELRQLCGTQGRVMELLSAEASNEQEMATALGEADQCRQQINAEELLGDLDNLLADTDHGLVQIADLVSSLKDFSRVDRSRNDLFDLNVGIDAALKICNSQLKGRIDVLRQFAELPEIECSPSQINQVFLNLINNAAQAIDGEGVITISTQAEKSGVVVRLSDTGSGMSEDVKRRIFEPFFTTKPVGQGTGLGLSIVFRIVEEHGGRIAVESTVGEGTTFSVHLPLQQARKPAERAAA